MGSGASPESRSSRIRALAAACAWAVRMRASRPGISPSFAPSATAVFGPAKPCLPSSPSVGDSMPHLQSNYFVAILLVLHEQSDSITHEIERYEQSLRDKGLPGISLHSGLLLTGHEGYEGMPLADRKRLLSSFRILFRNLPVRYTCIALRLSEYENMGHVEAAMRCGTANFLLDSLTGYHTRKDHLDSDHLRS